MKSDRPTPSQRGNYRFFIAYRIENPTAEEKKLLDENNWNTCIELGEGLTHADRVRNIIVFDEGTVPEEVDRSVLKAFKKILHGHGSCGIPRINQWIMRYKNT